MCLTNECIKLSVSNIKKMTNPLSGDHWSDLIRYRQGSYFEVEPCKLIFYPPGLLEWVLVSRVFSDPFSFFASIQGWPYTYKGWLERYLKYLNKYSLHNRIKILFEIITDAVDDEVLTANASFPSRITFTYFDKIIWMGWKSPLTMDVLPKLSVR